jgi:hypothetical protein
MGVGGQCHAPAALPLGKTRYPLCRRLGGPQGWSGQVLKISTPPGFDPWDVRPVVSRYTDWATPAHNKHIDTLRVVCHAWTLIGSKTIMYQHKKKRKKALNSNLALNWNMWENIHVHKPNYPYSTHYFRLGRITCRHKRCIYKLMQLCTKPRALANAKKTCSEYSLSETRTKSALTFTRRYPPPGTNTWIQSYVVLACFSVRHRQEQNQLLNCCFSVHFGKYKFFPFQQMHTLLKHKMLQFFLSYIAPSYMFRSPWTILREHIPEPH